MRIFRITLRAALAAFLTAALADGAAAAITRSFNYQGFLLNKETNQPVDGSKHVRFLIYDAAVGGSALFTELVCSVPMNKGRYEVEIGSNTPGGIDPDIFISNQNLWLQVEIAPTASCGGSFDPLSPRVRLQAAPFAFNSLYASTASAATSVFRADIIGALPATANGAITISTNLFVQGGISVGNISPGQQLSVSGLVESRGLAGCDVGPDYTCGFKFPDGSVQIRAAAETKWELAGDNMYNITTGNIGLGETVPRARLHVSSGIGEPGNLVLVSTGTSDIFRITGEGRVYSNYYHGDGSALTGTTAADLLRLLKSGDTMTGPLTLSGSSSMTIVNTNNSLSYSLAVTTDAARRSYHLAVTTGGFVGIGVSSPAARIEAARGAAADSQSQIWRDGSGVIVASMSSAGVMQAAFFRGDGSGLTDVFSTDPSRVLKAGDTMTGQLTLSGSSLTVAGSAGLAVNPGAWFSVGASTAEHKAYVDGGMLVTSSVTASGGLFAPSASISQHLGAGAVTASSGTFTAFGANQYSLETSSGIKVGPLGIIDAPYFRGNGAGLTNVTGTDGTRVLKSGDTMTGNLRVEGASVAVFGYGSGSSYALTVATVTNPSTYALAVSTQDGRVGMGVLAPSYPLHVAGQIGITAPSINDDARLTLRTGGGGGGYIAWDDATYPGIGVLGAPFGGRDLVYRAAATTMQNGTEIFRIKESGNFGIGNSRHTSPYGPQASLHIAVNMLVSTSAANPIMSVSTTTGMVGIGTASPSTHKLVVDGGMIVNSSLTVTGLYGSSTHGGLAVGAASAQARLHVVEQGSETYTLIVGSSNAFGIDYDMVVTTQGRVGIGLNSPLAKLHVAEGILIGTNLDTVASLQMNPSGGDAYIYFSDQAQPQKAAMGTPGGQTDFVFLAGAASNFTGGTEVYRIKKAGQFGIYHPNPSERLHIGSNLLLSTAAVSPILYVSTSGGGIGMGTASPQYRLHIQGGSDLNPAFVLRAGDILISTGGAVTTTGTGHGSLAGASRGLGAVDLQTRRAATGQVASGNFAVLSGGENNTASFAHSAVGGGSGNIASALYAFVGGGSNNISNTLNAAVLGGDNNIAGAQAASVAGGAYNTVSGVYSSVLGGFWNRVTGSYSAVAGGNQNLAAGAYAFIAGGRENHSPGNYSFSAGRASSSSAQGTFTWADSQGAVLDNAVQDRVRFKAAGGFHVSGSTNTADRQFFVSGTGSVGIGTLAPSAALDVSGDAAFGGAGTRTAFTAEGFWQPRAMTGAALAAAAPGTPGLVVYNSSAFDLCVSTGTGAGDWARVGSGGAAACY